MGAEQIEAQEGYFLVRSLAKSDLHNISVSVEVYRCLPGACSENNSCFSNRTGPVCGLCPPGWALTTNGCELCPEEQIVSRLRAGVYAVGILLLFTSWILLSWRPLIPQIDDIIAKLFNGILMCFSFLSCAGSAQELRGSRTDLGNSINNLGTSLNVLCQDLGMKDATDFLKILKLLTSYFQVVCPLWHL